MRPLYSVRNDRFGITFKPAKRARPSSRTELMTWLCRALPKSFKANSDRQAHAAGTIFDPADVVDGEVLLSQGDDQFPQAFLLAGRSARSCGRDEEATLGLVAELMDEDPEAPRCVPESSGCLGRGDTVDEEGPQGFVLPM